MERPRSTTSRISEEQIVRLRLGHISVRSGFFGFWGENLPTDPLFSGSGGGNSPPTVTDVRLVSSRAGSDRLGEWVVSRFLLDTLTTYGVRSNKRFYQLK